MSILSKLRRLVHIPGKNPNQFPPQPVPTPTADTDTIHQLLLPPTLSSLLHQECMEHALYSAKFAERALAKDAVLQSERQGERNRSDVECLCARDGYVFKSDAKVGAISRDSEKMELGELRASNGEALAELRAVVARIDTELMECAMSILVEIWKGGLEEYPAMLFDERAEATLATLLHDECMNHAPYRAKIAERVAVLKAVAQAMHSRDSIEREIDCLRFLNGE